MDNEVSRLARAICIVFEAEDDPATIEADALTLLKLARRGESELSLRKEVADLQSSLTQRVIDTDCRRVVELVQQLANA